MSVSTIRAGLARNLGMIPDIQILPYLVSEPTPPAIMIFPSDITYHVANADGWISLAFTIRVAVSFTSGEGSQMLLDQFMAPNGAQSILAAVESDQTLGGAADNVVVRSVTGPVLTIVNTNAYLTADWSVDVYADGTLP